MVINMIRYRNFNLLLVAIRRELHRGRLVLDSSFIYSSSYWINNLIVGKEDIEYA